MSNSMDCIYIRYHAASKRADEKENSYRLSLGPAKKAAKESDQTSATNNTPLEKPLLEFLKIPPSELSGKEHQLQLILKDLYEMNNGKPPLFNTFPDWRPNQPLTIDATSLSEDSENCQASFSKLSNIIRFQATNNMIDLINSLAHELKHAEQCSKEYYDIATGNNHLQRQKVRFIGEADAYPFGVYVQMRALKQRGKTDFITELAKTPDNMTYTLMPVLKKYLAKHKDFDWPSWQETAMPAILPALFKSSYKDDYDDYPIKNNDPDLTHLPSAFHVSRSLESKLLKKLKKIPRKAREPQKRFYQLLLNGHSKEALKFFQNFANPHPTFFQRISNLLFGKTAISTNEKPTDILAYTLNKFPSILPEFWPVIHSQADLTRLEQTLQKQLSVLEQCPNDWPNETIYWKVVSAAYMGMPNLMKGLINLKNTNGKRALDNEQLQRLFTFYCPLKHANFFPKDMPPKLATLSRNHFDEVTEVFFDLKDENGNYIFKQDDFPNTFVERYSKKHPHNSRLMNTTQIKIKSLSPVLLSLQNAGASFRKKAELKNTACDKKSTDKLQKTLSKQTAKQPEHNRS